MELFMDSFQKIAGADYESSDLPEEKELSGVARRKLTNLRKVGAILLARRTEHSLLVFGSPSQ